MLQCRHAPGLHLPPPYSAGDPRMSYPSARLWGFCRPLAELLSLCHIGAFCSFSHFTRAPGATISASTLDMPQFQASSWIGHGGERSNHRKIRKGTNSCWECKRRKTKCVFADPATTICDGCRRRSTNCVPQGIPEDVAKLKARPTDRLVRIEEALQRLARDKAVTI